MFFEGSEKKLEIVLHKECEDLLDLEDQWWRELVVACGGIIISKIENRTMKAFLLSESSLFVWPDRILMITCGTTQLVKSLMFFTHYFGKAAISAMIYQRKNEYNPRQQITTFVDDVLELKKHFKGEAKRFGHVDGHYNDLFGLAKKMTPNKNDQTFELLMYQIDGEMADFLRTSGHDIKKIRKVLGLEKLFNDFIRDDYLFSPFGYSFNGIRNKDYITMHITPQSDSSYISFECNKSRALSGELIFEYLIQLFRPNSFDLISFNETSQELFKSSGFEYLKTAHFSEKIICGHQVEFYQYVRENIQEQSATFLV